MSFEKGYLMAVLTSVSILSFPVYSSTESLLQHPNNTVVHPELEKLRHVFSLALPFVDKTLTIKTLIEHTQRSMIITRPRKMGKTVTLKMLEEFLDIKKDCNGLFQGLKIMRPEYQEFRAKHMNKYPVVTISFGDYPCATVEQVEGKLISSISDQFRHHSNVLTGNKLTEIQRAKIKKFSETKEFNPHKAAAFLVDILAIQNGVGPIILIDNYDIHLAMSATYFSFFSEMRTLLMTFFTSICREGDPQYMKCIVFGLVPVPFESFGSKIPNMRVFSIIDPGLPTELGFTEDEAKRLGKTFFPDLVPKTNGEINYYLFGKHKMYSPGDVAAFFLKAKSDRSVVKSGDARAKGDSNVNEHASETLTISQIQVVQELITDRSLLPALDFQNLLFSESITKVLGKEVNFGNIKNFHQDYWTYFYHAGFFEIRESRIFPRKTKLKCMNNNTRQFIDRQIKLLESSHDIPNYSKFTGCLSSRDTGYCQWWMARYLNHYGAHYLKFSHPVTPEFYLLEKCTKRIISGFLQRFEATTETNLHENKIVLKVTPHKGTNTSFSVTFITGPPTTWDKVKNYFKPASEGDLFKWSNRTLSVVISAHAINPLCHAFRKMNIFS